MKILDQKTPLILGFILLLTFAVYYPSLQNAFTNWDDDPYVVENLDIRNLSSKNIKHWFNPTTYHHGNYHPLTMISYTIEYHFKKLQPKIYHVNNLVLHLINTLLVFVFVFKLTKEKLIAYIAALLFALHPLHVESVAWISERKDVLYSLFFLGGLIFYTNYIELINKAGKKGLIKNYFLCIILFLTSLLSKPAAVIFPAVLIIIDFFLYRKFTLKAVIEKIPFFIISFIFGLLAIKAQESSEAIADFEVFTIAQRIMFAAYAMNMYIYKLFVPLGLSCFHPYPTLIGDRLPYIYYASPFISAIILGLTAYSFKKTRIIVFGILFYLINVALVLQFISVGNAIIAERYTYISYLGLFILVGYGVKWVVNNRPKYNNITAVLFFIMIGWFSFSSFNRTKDWKNAESLWTSYIREYPESNFGYEKRGTYWGQNGKEEAALKDFKIMLTRNPNSEKANLGIANIMGKRGKIDEAIASFSKVIKGNPKFFEAYMNRAISYSMKGQYDLAFADYKKAIELDPNNLKIYMNRSFALLQAKHFKEAITDYTKILQYYPNEPSYYEYRGLAYLNLNQLDKSIADYNKSLQLKPNNPNIYNNRGIAYERKKDFKKALSDILQAQKLGKKINANYINNLRQKTIN